MSKRSPAIQDSDQLALFSDIPLPAAKEPSRVYSHFDKVMSENQAGRKKFTSKEEYYQSPEWRVIRRQKLEQVGYRCERCGAGVGLDVHHISYDHLFDERMDELEVVCRECHGSADDQREWYSGLNTYASKKYGEDYGGDLSDVASGYSAWLERKRGSDW